MYNILNIEKSFKASKITNSGSMMIAEKILQTLEKRENSTRHYLIGKQPRQSCIT